MHFELTVYLKWFYFVDSNWTIYTTVSRWIFTPLPAIHVIRMKHHARIAIIIFIWFIYDANSTRTLTSLCSRARARCVSYTLLCFVYLCYTFVYCVAVVLSRASHKWSCYFYQKPTYERANGKSSVFVSQADNSVYFACKSVYVLMAIRKMVITCDHKSSAEWKYRIHTPPNTNGWLFSIEIQPPSLAH